MRFTAAALLAFASAVLAQTDGFNVLTKPTEGEVVPAGETYEIVWEPSADYGDKTVKIVLIGGPDQPSQQVIETLAEGVPSSTGGFSWEVDTGLGEEAVYGLQVLLEEDPETFQFSFPFTIKGDGHHSSSSSSSAAPSSSVSSAPSGYPSSTLSSSTISSFISSNLSTTAGPTSSPTKSTPVSSTSSTAAASSGPASAAANAGLVANGLAVAGGFAMAVLAL